MLSNLRQIGLVPLEGHHKSIHAGILHALIGLELQLEPEVGADLGPLALDEPERFQEAHPLHADEVGDDEGG
jgi:hypothetical protein